jgi:hypothetical protein
MHPWSALNPSHAVLQFEGLTFFFLNYPFCLSSALSPFLVNPTAFCCAWLSGGGGGTSTCRNGVACHWRRDLLWRWCPLHRV